MKKKRMGIIIVFIIIFGFGVILINRNSYSEVKDIHEISNGKHICIGTGRKDVRLEYLIKRKGNTFEIYQDKTLIHTGTIKKRKGKIVFVEDKTNREMKLFEKNDDFYIEASHYSGKLFENDDEKLYLFCK